MLCTLGLVSSQHGLLQPLKNVMYVSKAYHHPVNALKLMFYPH